MRKNTIRALLSAALAALLLTGAPVPAALAAECGEEEPCADADAQPESYYYGDLDRSGGVPDAFDAALLLGAAAGLRPPFALDLTYADVNGDGEADMRDAAYILSSPDWTDAKQYTVVPGPPLRKPVIYLYPETRTDVTVTLGRPEALTCVYPAYNGGWRVTAEPDGTLTGADGRAYYALYYEAALPASEGEDGFVVARGELAGFLEEKLALLGLNEREAEEMIIYWLPLMQEHAYVFVRFASAEEAAEAMPLEITPAPDTVIRVWMLWRGLDEPAEAPVQQLPPVSRGGFTAVEWGGMELP